MWGHTPRNGATTNVSPDGVVMTYRRASRARGAITTTTIIIIITMVVIIIKARSARATGWVLRGRRGCGVGRRLCLMCLLLSIVVCLWGPSRFCMFWTRLGTCSSFTSFLFSSSFLLLGFFLLMVFPFWLSISLTSNSFLSFFSLYGFYINHAIVSPLHSLVY